MFSVYDGPDAHCILLSKRPTALVGLRNVLEHNAAQLDRVSDYAALDSALVADPDINVVMIDLDSYDSVIARVEALSHLRFVHRDRPTILLSEDFETDEFGMHRRMLGDVSLRVPVLHASLEIALLQAPVNNLEWRRHLEEMSSEPVRVVNRARHEAIMHSGA